MQVEGTRKVSCTGYEAPRERTLITHVRSSVRMQLYCKEIDFILIYCWIYFHMNLKIQHTQKVAHNFFTQCIYT
jgi:hypothetical protein